MSGMANYMPSTVIDSDIPAMGGLWPQFVASLPVHEPALQTGTALPAASSGTQGCTDATPTKRRITEPSVVALHGMKDRVKTRFRILRRLLDNHDREGACGANKASVDAAIAFIDSMTHYPPFFATLDDDGFAVIEFEDKATGFFADLTFKPNHVVECYRRTSGKASLSYAGSLKDEDIQQTLIAELRIAF
jgi:hypothetical protein